MNDDEFSAVGPTEEERQPKPSEMELFAPLISPIERRNLLDLEQKANHRGVIFFVSLVVLCAFFYLLYAALRELTKGELVDFVAVAGTVNWHVLVLLGFGLVILASIPLSILLALLRALNGVGSHAKDEGSGATTPALALVQSLADVVKLIAEKAKS